MNITRFSHIDENIKNTEQQFDFFCFLIGTPCAFVKILIENIDGIVCRYDKVGDTVKPKIRVIFWIVLALGLAAAICLTVLKCLNKI